MPHPSQELTATILPDQTITLEWQDTLGPIPKDQDRLQTELFKRYQSDVSSFLFYLGFVNPSTPLSPGLTMIRKFSTLFIKKLSQTPELEALRDKAAPELSPDETDEFLSNIPFMVGAEYISPSFFQTLWKQLTDTFKTKIKSHKGPVESFFQSFSGDIHIAGKVYFHLVESKDENLPFAFLATYSTGLNELGISKHIPLKHALSEYGKDSTKLLELLSAVYLAARESKIVSELIESGEIFHPIALSVKEAYNLLREIPVYEKYGIICRIPNWWKTKTSGIKLDIRIGSAPPSFLGKAALLDFKIEIVCGEHVLSESEIKKLLSASEGLAFIKGKWMEVDPEKLQQTLLAFKKAQGLMKSQNGLSLKEAMHLQLNLQKNLGLPDDDTVGVSNGVWLKSVIEKLKNPDLLQSVKLPANFTAVLRPYQQKGLNWLCFLHGLKFGACLADDMGLGKTVQLLAFLSTLAQNEKNTPSLLLMPASLISNWVNEITRFSPDLKYCIAHPSYSDEQIFAEKNFLKKYDLILSTYSSFQKYEALKSHFWNYVILDEAQAIKNPGSKQTIAVKTLLANNKIILTGTPVENRIGDLWSLFDFLNPGLLGSRTEFSDFSKTLKDNTGGFAKLRKITSPYILRRLKTDRTVISDLPQKVEMKTYPELSKKQIALYQNLVKEIKTVLEQETAGIKRKGLILASLMKFKQICNHPAQYLGGGDYSEEDSGKFLRLRELCETIYEKRERVLIFTQFKEITAYLQHFLSTIFAHQGLIFHGSIPIKKRKEILDKFQSTEYVPFMVISLKAGGYGLNLTAANHVIHFDRWWNPAVENQATDRAFRIGQKKNVLVHKFITKGTLEEKIDAMLEEKGKLSSEIIQSADGGWIGEMNNEKLMNLLTLSINS